MNRAQKALIALLVISNVLVFSSGLLLGLSSSNKNIDEPGNITRTFEDPPIPEFPPFYTYSAIGRVNESIWTAAWGTIPKTDPLMTVPEWQNDSYLAIMEFYNWNDTEIAIRVDFHNKHAGFITVDGIRAVLGTISRGPISLICYTPPDQIRAVDYISIFLFMHGSGINSSLLISSFLNVTLSWSE